MGGEAVTCIAAVTDGLQVVMGGDSLVVDSDGMAYVAQDPKVFRVGGMLIGAAGWARICDVAASLRDIPTLFGDPEPWVRGEFIGILRKAMRQSGCLRGGDDSPEEMPDKSCLLIGLAGRIYLIDDSFGIVTPPAWGFAIGSGAAPAMGSLHTTGSVREWAFFDLKKRVLLALQASEQCSPNVRGPFVIEEVA